MISSLASPSVCLIDEDENDYRPILDALNGLYVSCVHIRGDSIDQLPLQPFRGLRLVFTDLHLTGSSGKDAASHTANVFRKVVYAETAPIVVVIWSKYAGDIADPDRPPEDQETEAELFKRTLLEAEGKYIGRLIFIEMEKPKPDDRNQENWFDAIKAQINIALEGKDAIDALWIWESLARDAAIRVSAGLTSISQEAERTLDNLKEAMQLLTHAQSEGNKLSVAAAPHYLSSVLAQLLMDHLEHADGVAALQRHGDWLASKSTSDERTSQLAPVMNCFLLTTDVSDVTVPLMPGMVYAACDDNKLQELFGVSRDELVLSLYKSAKKGTGVEIETWKKDARIVLVELSPGCDLDNGSRFTAILMAGLILPSVAKPNAKSDGAFQVFPNHMLRREMEGFAKQEAFMVFCSRYKATLPSTGVPEWLKPWFRLRELPTAALRNWFAGHASRVGYVSLE